jgi:hypothetical protein
METFHKYLCHPNEENLADSYHFLAQACAKLDNQAGQIRALHQLCAAEPGRRSGWGDLAVLYYNKCNYRLAASLFELLLKIPMPTDRYALYKWHSKLPSQLLVRCYEQMQVETK